MPRPRWPNRHAARGHRGGMPKPSTRTAAPTWRVAIRTSCSSSGSASGRRGGTQMRPGAFRTTLRRAPRGPHHRRAEEHLKDLQSAASQAPSTATATATPLRVTPAPPPCPHRRQRRPRGAEPAAIPPAPAAAAPNATSSPPAVDLRAAAAPAAAPPAPPLGAVVTRGHDRRACRRRGLVGTWRRTTVSTSFSIPADRPLKDATLPRRAISRTAPAAPTFYGH